MLTKTKTLKALKVVCCLKAHSVLLYICINKLSRTHQFQYIIGFNITG